MEDKTGKPEEKQETVTEVNPGWDVRDEFSVHMLNEQGKQKAHEIAGRFSELLSNLERLCGATSREMLLARTNLQNACFWAKRAMAVDPSSQQP